MPTAVVTGATGAIGKAIAAGLVQHGFHVVLAVRDAAKAARLQRDLGTEATSLALVDLSRAETIHAAFADLNRDVHVLVNNAATAPPRRHETPEGIEVQWATNVLSYVWMVDALAPRLAPGARVVNVASYWAGGLDLDDLEFRRRRYDNDAAYRQSKQANRMLTVAQADALAAAGVTVNACHPGDVRSTLSLDLGFGGHESPTQGAATPLWLATDAGLQGVSARYFEHQAEARCRFGTDRAAVAALWQRVREKYCAIL